MTSVEDGALQRATKVESRSSRSQHAPLCQWGGGLNSSHFIVSLSHRKYVYVSFTYVPAGTLLCTFVYIQNYIISLIQLKIVALGWAN